MRILIVSPYFPPQLAAASLRVYSFARTWAEAGHDITVLTTEKRRDQHGLNLARDGFEVVEVPYRTPWYLDRVRSADKASDDQDSSPDTAMGTSASLLKMLRRVRARTGIYSTLRMPDLTDGWVTPAAAQARAAAASRPWDVVVSSSGPYTAHLVAQRLRRHGHARTWIADFRDLWTENHVARGLFPFSLRERHLERQCLADADVLTAATDGVGASLHAKAGATVHIIYNGFDPDDRNEIDREPFLPRDDRVHIVYTGRLYAAGQDTSPFLEAISLMQRHAPDMHRRLRLEVAGHESEQWVELARPFGVEGVIERHGIVSRNDALRMQRDADALLLVDWQDPVVGVLPVKTFEYLHAEAPILLIGPDHDSSLRRMLVETGRGHLAGNDPRSIAGSLERLIRDPASLTSDRDDASIRRYTRSAQAMRLLHVMSSVV